MQMLQSNFLTYIAEILNYLRFTNTAHISGAVSFCERKKTFKKRQISLICACNVHWGVSSLPFFIFFSIDTAFLCLFATLGSNLGFQLFLKSCIAPACKFGHEVALLSRCDDPATPPPSHSPTQPPTA